METVSIPSRCSNWPVFFVFFFPFHVVKLNYKYSTDGKGNFVMETHTHTQKSSRKYKERHTYVFSHNSNMRRYGENDGRISYLILTTPGVIVTSDSKERRMKVY